MSTNTDVPDGDREVRRAGEEPPDIPSEATLEDLLPQLLDGVDDIETGYHVRAALRRDDPDGAAGQLVDALERKVEVVGSTLDAGIDPADPQVDVLIQCEYTASQVASALGGVSPVRGAVVVEATDVCERHLADDEPDEADGPSANDVFNELQQQVSELDYDEVVDELEDVSFPGGPDPDEEVDLAAEVDVDLDTATNGAGGEAALDADGGVAADGEFDEVDAEDLFGDGEADERESTSATLGADEDQIEEAVKSVELSMDDADDADEPTEDGTLTDEAGDGLAGQATTDDSAADDSEVEAGTAADAAVDQGQTADAAPAEETDDATADSEVDDIAGADVLEDAGTSPGTGSDGDDGDETAASPAGTGDGSPFDAGQPTDGRAEGASGEFGASPNPSAPTAADAGESAGTDGKAEARASADGDVGELIDDLVASLESGAVGPERRQQLREALGVESTHSLDVRLEYVQKRVDNLAAYTDAWEAFLAEEGTADQFRAELHDEIEQLSARVDALETGEADGSDGLGRRLDELERRHDEAVERLDDRVDAVADERDRRLGDLEETVDSLRRSVEALGNWRDRVNDVLGDRL